MKKLFFFTSLFCSASLFMLGISACQGNSAQQEQATTPKESAASNPAPNSGTSGSPVTASATQGPAESLPMFTFFNPKNGFAFKQSDFPKDGKRVFILFDPGCGHCQTETTAIGKNIEKFNDATFCFVSLQEPSLIMEFANSYGKALLNRDNVRFLFDRNMEFINRFHVPKELPAVYIYDAKGKLQTSWEGERSIDDLLKAVNN